MSSSKGKVASHPLQGYSHSRNFLFEYVNFLKINHEKDIFLMKA